MKSRCLLLNANAFGAVGWTTHHPLIARTNLDFAEATTLPMATSSDHCFVIWFVLVDRQMPRSNPSGENLSYFTGHWSYQVNGSKRFLRYPVGARKPLKMEDRILRQSYFNTNAIHKSSAAKLHVQPVIDLGRRPISAGQ